MCACACMRHGCMHRPCTPCMRRMPAAVHSSLLTRLARMSFTETFGGFGVLQQAGMRTGMPRSSARRRSMCRSPGNQICVLMDTCSSRARWSTPPSSPAQSPTLSLPLAATSPPTSSAPAQKTPCERQGLLVDELFRAGIDIPAEIQQQQPGFRQFLEGISPPSPYAPNSPRLGLGGRHVIGQIATVIFWRYAASGLAEL